MSTLQNIIPSPAKPLTPSIAASSLRVFTPAEADVISAFGQSVRVLLPAAHTGGAIAIVDVEVPSQEGPPPHIHHAEDETFLVTKGRFEFWLDGDHIEAGPGDIVYGPRDVPHTFRNITSEVATLQVIAVTAGFESFFRQCAEVWGGENVMPQIMQIAQNHHLEFVDPQTTPKIGAPANGKTPRVVHTGEGGTLAGPDGASRVAVSKRDSAGDFALGWLEVLPGEGPKVHVHKGENQILLIASGAFEFSAGGVTARAQAGDVVWLPRDTEHSFRCAGAEGGKMLGVLLPERLASIAGESAPLPHLENFDFLPASN